MLIAIIIFHYISYQSNGAKKQKICLLFERKMVTLWKVTFYCATTKLNHLILLQQNQLTGWPLKLKQAIFSLIIFFVFSFFADFARLYLQTSCLVDSEAKQTLPLFNAGGQWIWRDKKHQVSCVEVPIAFNNIQKRINFSAS